MADRDRAALRLKKLAVQFVDEEPPESPTRRERRPSGFKLARAEPGSIEQHLDMIEEGDLRGDEIEHMHNDPFPNPDEAIEDIDQMLRNYRMNMAESNREGDEMSGDEHSSGLQGDELPSEDDPGEELD